MPLDDHFVFSAHSLQDYVDCPRRFELKYLLRQDWPAIVSQPVKKLEEKMAQGSQFHLLARQYLEGLPAEVLTRTLDNPRLREWFDRFTLFVDPLRENVHFSEYASMTTLANFQALAIFDFVASAGGQQVIIADWKTTESEPRQKFYQDRMQTLLYPVVAYDSAAKALNMPGSLEPADISLWYWFPAYPEKRLEFPQTPKTIANNRALLENLIREIAVKTPGDFAKTSHVERCAFCPYRSLCERGSAAGYIDEDETLDVDALIANLDFDAPGETIQLT